MIEARSNAVKSNLHRNLECQVNESRQIGSGQTRDGKSAQRGLLIFNTNAINVGLPMCLGSKMMRGVLRTGKEGPEKTGQTSSPMSPRPWGAHFTQHTAYCPGGAHRLSLEIGRASCRERVSVAV